MEPKRKLFEADERFYIQQAEQTIKSDPVLAFVELITNSDDSYRKLEFEHKPISGKILIQVVPKRKNESLYEIYDEAQGMHDQEMTEKITKYGADTSGLTEETGGRSFFGRGLKECMIAFGKAEVRSIKDGIHYSCSSEGARVDRMPSKRTAQRQDYEDLRIPRGGNGTRVRLFAKNSKLQTPQFKSFARSLSLHYSLRDILSNPKRKLTLRYVYQNTKGEWVTKDETDLCYKPLSGDKILDQNLKIDEYPNAEIHLEAFKSKDEIRQAPTKYEDERGFLICSKDAVHDVYHFGFKNHDAAGFIYGRVTCFYIDHMLRTEEEPVITNSRDGMHWSHPFCMAIDNAVSKFLRQIFQQESEVKTKMQKKYENDETSKRIIDALNFLNKIAEQDLGDSEGAGGGEKTERTKGDGPTDPPTPRDKTPKRIPNGFAFSPPYVRMDIKEPKTITLKIELTDGIDEQSIIDFSTNNQAIEFLDQAQVRVQQFIDTKKVVHDNGEEIAVVTVRSRLKCDESEIEAKVTASCKGKKAELEVCVSEATRKSGGLFSDYQFNPEAPPEQRVQFISGTGVIQIATMAPSFVKYFGPKGENQNTPEAQSLLAELILDVCCAELVRQKFRKGAVVLFNESDPVSISEQYNFEMIQYKNRLAESIHKFIANS